MSFEWRTADLHSLHGRPALNASAKMIGMTSLKSNVTETHMAWQDQPGLSEKRSQLVDVTEDSSPCAKEG